MIDWQQRWRQARAMALEAIESMEKANEHTAHLLAALDAVTKAAGITADRMTTDEAARAVADHIAAQRAAIDRLTRERDEARALVQHAYLTAWAARHNHCKATPPDMRKGWRAFALSQGLPFDPNPANKALAAEVDQ